MLVRVAGDNVPGSTTESVESSSSFQNVQSMACVLEALAMTAKRVSTADDRTILKSNAAAFEMPKNRVRVYGCVSATAKSRMRT